MYHEIKVRARGDGWFEIDERHTPRSPYALVATVYGEARANRVAELLRSPHV